MAENKSELRDESLPGISHSVGDLVLVKWNDGMVYFAKIKRIDNRLRKCVVVFDDKSTDEADFSQIHSVDETTTDIICIKCKHDDSDVPNEIVLCDTCGIGYHQLCHIPTIPASAIQLDQPWHCIYCQKKLKNPYLTESIDVIQTLFDGNDAVTSDHDTNDDNDHDHDAAEEEMEEEVTLPHSKDGEVLRRAYSVDHGRHSHHIHMNSQISSGPGRKRKGRRASEMSVSRTVSPRLNSPDPHHRAKAGRGRKRKRMGDGIGLMKKRRTSTVLTHTLSVKQVPLSMPTRKMPQVIHGLSSDDDSEEDHPQGSPEIEPISSDRRPRSLRVSLTIPPSLESSPAPPSNSSHPVSPVIPSPPGAALSPQPSSEHSFVTSSSQPHSPISDKTNTLMKPTSAHDMSDDVFSDFCSSFDKNTSAPPQLSHITTAQPTSEADSVKSPDTNPPLDHSAIQTDKVISGVRPAQVSSDLAEAHGSQHDKTSCTSSQSTNQATKVIVSPGVTQLMPVKHRKTSVIQQSFSPSPNSTAIATSSTTAFRYPSPPLHATAVSTARTSAITYSESAQTHIVQSRYSLPSEKTYPASTASSIKPAAAPGQPNRPSAIPATMSYISGPQQHKLQHQKPQPQLTQSVVRQPPSLPPPALAQANSHPVQPQRRMQDIPGQVLATREVHHPETICAPVGTQHRTVITSGSQANPMVSVMVTPTTISATGEVAAVYTFVPASHVKGTPSPVVTYTSSPSPSTKEVIYNSSLTAVEVPRPHQQQVRVNPVPASEPTAVGYTSNGSNYQRSGAVVVNARAQSEFKHTSRVMLDQQPLNSNGNATKSYAIVNTAPATVAVHGSSRYLTSSPPPLAPKQHPVHALERRVVYDSFSSQQRIPVQQARRTQQFVEPAHPANSSVNRRQSSQVSIVREIPPLRSHIESGIDLLHDETSTELANHLRKMSHRYGKEFDSLGRDKLMEIFHDAWKKFQGNGRKYEAFMKHRKIARTANVEVVTPTPAVPVASPIATPVQKGRILVHRQQPQYIAVNSHSPATMHAAATPVSTPTHPLPPLAPVNSGVNYMYAAYPNTSAVSMQQQPVIVGATPNVINVVEAPSPPPLSSAQLSRSHQVQTSGVFVPPPSSNPHTVTVLPSPTATIPRQLPHQRILKPKPTQIHQMQQNIHPHNPQMIQSRVSSPSSSSGAVLIQRPIVTPSDHDIALAAAAQPRRHARVSSGPVVTRTPVGNANAGRRNSSTLAGPPHACARCERDATYLCSGCHMEWYCSRDCQLKAWDAHAEHCKS